MMDQTTRLDIALKAGESRTIRELVGFVANLTSGFSLEAREVLVASLLRKFEIGAGDLAKWEEAETPPTHWKP